MSQNRTSDNGTSVTDVLNHTTAFTYDLGNPLTQITIGAGDAPRSPIKTATPPAMPKTMPTG